MDTQSLIAAIEAEIEKEDRLPEEKIFFRLLKEVWQVDCTISAYSLWIKVMEGDITYFSYFMTGDEGDEQMENRLIRDWKALQEQPSSLPFSGLRERIIPLIGHINDLREL